MELEGERLIIFKEMLVSLIIDFLVIIKVKNSGIILFVRYSKAFVYLVLYI